MSLHSRPQPRVSEQQKVVMKERVTAFQAGSGPVYICLTRNSLTQTLLMSNWCWDEVRVLKSWEGSAKDLQAIHHVLLIHHLRGRWYAPSPEVLELVEREGRDVSPAPLTGGRRLTREQVLEVFRTAHGTSQPHRIIGQHYGVSQIAVGKIARGQVYPKLFERTPPDEKGVYYVWERGVAGAPRFKFRKGWRSTK